MSYIVDISLPEISCLFQMFTFVTSCCSPHISTSQQKSSTECLIWCQSGCVRILPFDRLRGFCHSTVSKSAGARSKNSVTNHSTFQKKSELLSIGGGHVVPVVNNTTCFSIYKWLLFLLLFSSYFPLLSHSFLK